MKKLLFLALMLAFFDSSLMANNWRNLATPGQINELIEIDNKIYMATWGGLVIYDPQSQETQRLFKTAGFLSNRIEDITVDENSNIWIGTYDNGVAMFDGSSWINYEIPRDLVGTQVYIYSIEASNGAIYAATTEGLFKLSNDIWSVISPITCWDLSKGDDDKLYLAAEFPHILENDTLIKYSNCPRFSYEKAQILQAQNTLYFATHGTVSVLNNGNWTEVIVDGNQGFNDVILDMEIMQNGELWVIVEGKGLYSYDAGSFHLEFDFSNPQVGGSLQLLEVNGNKYFTPKNKLFIKDSNQSLSEVNISYQDWNGNWVQQLYSAEDKLFFKNRTTLYEINTENFQSSVVPSFAHGVDYNDWNPVVSRLSGELAYFNHHTGQFYIEDSMQVLFDTSVIDLPNTINDIMLNVDGKLWVATFSGLYVFYNGTYDHYTTNNTTFESNIYWTIGVDNLDNIWVSTSKEIAVNDNTSWTDYYNAANLNYVFGGPGFGFNFDINNTMYYICWANGLVKLENGTWTNYQSQNSDLPHNRIEHMHRVNGKLYLSTFEGLSIFDGQNFENLTQTNSGLGHNECKASVFDKEGNLWISSNYGLSVYNKNGVISGLTTTQPDLNTLVYPNPSQGIVHIQSDEWIESVQLYDTKGSLVYSTSVNGKTISIPMDDFQQGIYFFRIIGESKIGFEKVILD